MEIKKINEKKFNFKWNVFIWDINHDRLETYDVVPTFISELNRLKKNEKPKTKEEFDEFLQREARYHFWSKCEYEVIIQSWPKFKNEEKVDVYEQLEMNWEIFKDSFWNFLEKDLNSSHRKQRGHTAPNRALKK